MTSKNATGGDAGSAQRDIAIQDTPVWERVRDDAPVRQRFTGRAVVDVAIVGAGLTGLSAALHILRERPHWSVLVLEADRVGAGASGRSTGIVGPGVGGRIRYLRRRYGPETARAAFQHSEECVQTVIRLVQDEGIDCAMTPSSHLLCAATRAQAAMLGREERAFAELGLTVPFLSRREVSDRLGHPAYFGALAYQPVVQINPLGLSLGLADAVVRAGGRVAEQSPVTEVNPHRGGVRLRVGPYGEVDAHQVVIATDGYTPPGLPHGRRIVPVRTHVLATRPLTPAERAELGWSGHEAVIDQRFFFSYYRFDEEGRLLFGGGPVCGPNASPAFSERIWIRLAREFGQRFPALGHVPFTHRWSGLTGATLDRIPVLGPVPGMPGVIFAGAWTGHGLAMSVGCGPSVAALLTKGHDPAGRPWHRSRTGTPRLGPLQPFFVKSYVTAMDAVDRGGALIQRLRGVPERGGR
ncbi:FAD-binding oxidoreductase [Streptomyces sp. ME19-01-6]|uniref:NAD(P)/FAD-dependent oxidoreductase n=1 Tax=Streptomyces sp. ME19-01-6 TaxID=3028686 RepID=UPI0029ADEDA9|nr:FAD-binding oxidoreductase [Streptomyces sp. ME19-01-6]MDX3225010.1 FAD-binding oxidoreductase [Streptomyces sp. ME19-01-6]